MDCWRHKNCRQNEWNQIFLSSLFEFSLLKKRIENFFLSFYLLSTTFFSCVLEWTAHQKGRKFWLSFLHFFFLLGSKESNQICFDNIALNFFFVRFEKLLLLSPFSLLFEFFLIQKYFSRHNQTKTNRLKLTEQEQKKKLNKEK